MDTASFEKKLLAIENELKLEIGRFEEEAREPRTAEVEDQIDEAVSDEAKATAFQLTTAASTKLEQVRDALQRIKDGTYGTCIDCGEKIERARLEAVPWTPYCLKDQEKHDQEANEQTATL